MTVMFHGEEEQNEEEAAVGWPLFHLPGLSDCGMLMLMLMLVPVLPKR